MAQTTPLPKFILIRDLGSFLDSGQSFFNSLFSPDPTTTASNGKASTPITTPVGQITTTPTAPTILNAPTTVATPSTPIMPPNQSPTMSTTIRGAMPTPFGSPSTAKNTYSRSTPGIDPTALGVSSSHGSVLASSSAASAPSSNSTQSSFSSSSPRKHSETGSIVAGVIIGLLLLLSITILAFIYARRHRKRENKAWKRLSERGSILTVSSIDRAEAATEKPKDVLLPPFPTPTTSEAMARPPPRFSYDWSPVGVDITATSTPRQTPTVIITEPLVCEPRYEQAQQQQPHSSRRMTPVLRTGSPLPPALIAGRRPTPELSSYNGFNRIKEVWISPRNTSRSTGTVTPNSGQALEPTGGFTSSTSTASKKQLERKPVPKRSGAESGRESGTQPASASPGSIDDYHQLESEELTPD